MSYNIYEANEKINRIMKRIKKSEYGCTQDGHITLFILSEVKDLLDTNEQLFISWSFGDIIKRAKQNKIEITKDQAILLLQEMEKKYDDSIGINWEVVDWYIRNIDMIETGQIIKSAQAQKKFESIHVNFSGVNEHPVFNAYHVEGDRWNNFYNVYLERSEVEKLVKHTNGSHEDDILWKLEKDGTLLDLHEAPHEVIKIKPETITVNDEDIEVWYLGGGLTWTRVYKKEE